MDGYWNNVRLQLIDWAPRVLLAVLILIAAHFLAKAAKWGIAQAVDRIPFFPRRENLSGPGGRPVTKVGERVGEVGYWLVWLLGLISALSVLDAEQVFTPRIIAPLNEMVTRFVEYVPNIVGAALIFLIGFALATIVRRMVEATVQAIDLDKRLVDAGLTHTLRGPGLARLLGLLVFTLILIPVSIAALEALRIEAISEPAIGMLQVILDAIPRVVAAGLVIFIAYLVGRWVASLAEEGLQSMGFDEAIRAIGSSEPIRVGLRDTTSVADDAPVMAPTGFPPSRVVAIAVLAGIVLFAAIEAARLLGFAAMAQMLGEVLSLATRVLFGAIIIAVGVVIANVLAAAATRSDKPSSEVVGTLVRWGVITLAAAVGLRFMGLANDIIVLAFGLVLGAVAVAVAIAFGIGGRDAAKRMLARWSAE